MLFFSATNKTKGYHPPAKKKRKKGVIVRQNSAKKSYLVVTLLFVIIILFVLILFALPRLIKIDTVTCTNQYSECSASILGEIKDVDQLSFFHTKKRIEDILLEAATVEDYMIAFKLPSQIEIRLVEKKAKFAVRVGDDLRIALVSGSGEVISFSESTNLPLVVVDRQFPNLGGKVDDSLLFGLEIMSDVFFTHSVHTGRIEMNSLVIELNTPIKVIFPLEGDRELLLGSLNLIVDKLNHLEDEFGITDGNINPKVIDLRYKNPVIK